MVQWISLRRDSRRIDFETSIDWHESALVAFQHGYVRIELPAPLAYNRPGRVELIAARSQPAR